MTNSSDLRPAHALYALAAGHTIWGAVAYRDQLAGLVRELPGSVGDGIFETAHSRDARAAAYWFLFVGPMLGVMGRLYDSAEANGDRQAMRAAGRSITAVSLSGVATFRYSGFPAGVAAGIWMLRRAGRS